MIIATTDGSSTGKKGIGAASTIIQYPNGRTRILTRCFPAMVGNNHMELYAVWLTVHTLHDNARIHVRTDSKNVIGWLSLGFERKDPLINEYTSAILDMITTKQLTITFEHVKGHASDIRNLQADSLAKFTKVLARDIDYTIPA